MTDFDLELELLSSLPEDAVLVGMDEVGRGSLAGPVSVGAVAVSSAQAQYPSGLTDSKKLSPRRREELVKPIKNWALGAVVGHASNTEIDDWGLTVALRLAGRRALAELLGSQLKPAIILLDGPINWLQIPPPDLLTSTTHPDFNPPFIPEIPVRTCIKADLRCVSVAAAAIVAKVCRDQLMQDLPDPGYAWAANKGYSSAAHMQALKELGPSDFHRRSWKLPGIVKT